MSHARYGTPLAPFKISPTPLCILRPSVPAVAALRAACLRALVTLRRDGHGLPGVAPGRAALEHEGAPRRLRAHARAVRELEGEEEEAVVLALAPRQPEPAGRGNTEAPGIL